VHLLLATLVDGGDEEHRCRRQGLEHRLRQWIRHIGDPSFKIG
jgi:hypothetical protein